MVGNLLGGVVYQTLGPPTLFAVAAFVGAGAAVAGWLVLPRGRDLRGAPDLVEPPILEPGMEPAVPVIMDTNADDLPLIRGDRRSLEEA
jgi:hypothetical protein